MRFSLPATSDERGDGKGFALEPLAELLCRNLNGYISAEASITRLPHFAHAALANRHSKLVGAQPGTCTDGHKEVLSDFTSSSELLGPSDFPSSGRQAAF